MAKLNTVRDALLSVMDNVGHYEALKKAPPYVVWAEDGANALRGDNITTQQAISGTADLFTKKENDPRVAMIQNAFNSFGISWYLNSIQFEDDTKYIHYEWVWSIG